MSARLAESFDNHIEPEINKRNFKTIIIEVNGQLLPVKSYRGGRPLGDNPPPSQEPGQPSPYAGIRDISELTMVAYMTPYQDILTEAAETVANKAFNERYTIKIKTLSKNGEQRTLIYDQCLLTSLDFPTLDADGGELLCQTATFKPAILNVV